MPLPHEVGGAATKVADKITGGLLDSLSQQVQRLWYRRAFDRYRAFVGRFPDRLSPRRSLTEDENRGTAEDALTLKQLSVDHIFETVGPASYKSADGYRRTGNPSVFSEWLPVHRRRMRRMSL
jgi:hypothetical protein